MRLGARPGVEGWSVMRHRPPDSPQRATSGDPGPRRTSLLVPLLFLTVFEAMGSLGRYTSRMLDALTLRLRGRIAARQRTAEKYFPLIDPGLPNERAVQKIERAIAEHGSWSESVEWRISTEMKSRIEPVHRDGKTVYRVTVSCSYELSAECPTLARAIQFQRIYAALIGDMFWNLGWPSWSTRSTI